LYICGFSNKAVFFNPVVIGSLTHYTLMMMFSLLSELHLSESWPNCVQQSPEMRC